ncbi:MAG: radical SAM protein [Candidatus Methanomethylicia archaeon]
MFLRGKYGGICKICGIESKIVSSVIGVCVDCLRNNWSEAKKIILNVHGKSRARYGLPQFPPKSIGGLRCGICDLDCILSVGDKGFCGLVENVNGKLVRHAGTPMAGLVEWYYDPIPTNCVGAWFCPASTGLGYPKYALTMNGEHGYYNLAVFYGGCNSDCLFCQNWQHKQLVVKGKPLMSAEDLASKVNFRTTCICFFGGDPSPHVVHALAVSEYALKKASSEGRILRICWETNGHFSEAFMNRIVDVSLKSGGIIKFDLKAWSPEVYYTLTGIDIGRVYENVKLILKHWNERPEVPLFMASTLLVPGYVDVYEVEGISRFLASFDRNIPYSLLAFHPDYLLIDLPPTSKSHAKIALETARNAGLRNVNLGNIFLLGNYY